MKTNKKRTKILAVMLIMIMGISGLAVLLDNTSDAAVGDGGTYSYTLVYNSAQMGNTAAQETQLTVAGMTPISHASGTTTLTALANQGSWTWDYNKTTHVGSGLGPFNSFYAAFDIDDGNKFVTILNPYNLGQDLSGTALPNGNYNIMWVLPTVYWKVVDGNVTLTNDPNAGGTAYAHTINGHVYNYIAIGVYHGSTTTIDNGNTTVLTSKSGVAPTNMQTRATFRDQANNYTMDESLGANAYSMLWNFYQWELYKLCCYTVMEGFNSQMIVGNGNVYGGNSTKVTGGADALGPYAGNPGDLTASGSNATIYGQDYAKLFIEEAWGTVRDFVDGVVVDANQGFYIDTSNEPTDSTTAGGYVEYIAQALPSTNFGATISTSNAKTWGYAETTNASTDYYNKGMTDKTYTATSGSKIITVGGNSDSGSSRSINYGMSHVYADYDLTTSYNYLGSRLAFVFDVGPTSTVTITTDQPDYGSVAPTQVLSVPYGTPITVSNNTLSINGTTVTATPTTDTAQYDYEFTGWNVSNGDVVTGDITISASFTRTVKQYTVSIAVNNGSLGSVNNNSVTVDYGTTISTNGNVLTIGTTAIMASPNAADAQYTYSFSVWTGTTATVTGNMTITANFTATVNNYVVTIVASPSGYGNVSTSSFTVPYGTAISAAANVLTVGTGSSTATASSATAQYTYAFDSWTGIPAGGTITGNTSVTAEFSATVNTYTVTIQPNDNSYGSVSTGTVSSVPYGSTVSVNGSSIGIYNAVVTASPATDTAQYDYGFSGWSVANGYTVIGNTTITANFTRTLQEYTVNIVSNDVNMGTVIPVGSITGVDYGSVISISGNQLTLDGTVVTATAAEATVYYTYSFGSFDVTDGDIVTGNMTITANFTSSVTTFIVLITPNNSSYGSVTVDEISGTTYGMVIDVNGDTVTVNDISSQALPASQDTQYTYAFSSWSVNDGDTVNGDMTITANFTATLRNYTVTVQADSTGYGSIIPSTPATVPYGSRILVNGSTIIVNNIPYTAVPVAQTAEYTYRFVSWSVSDNTEVTGDLTVTASFERSVRNYTVYFEANDPLYGSVDPDRILNVPYGSTFTVDGNTITLIDQDVTATAASPSSQYTFAFGSWSVENNAQITGEMTVTANFTQTLRNYTVTIQPNDNSYGSVSPGTVLNVPYGTIISATDNTLDVNGTTVTATPEDADVQYTYSFGSWSIGESATLQGDMTITAVFEATTKTYTVTFSANVAFRGTISPSSISNVPYGSVISVSSNVLSINGTQVTATPHSPEQQWTYLFDSWSVSDGDTITGDTSITATFERELTKYTVTIVPNDPSRGTLSQNTVTDVPYGTSIYATYNILIVGSTQITATTSSPDVQYTYGWGSYTGIPMSGEVRNNTTVTAGFTATLNNYTITWSIDGTETTQQYPYGTMPSHAEPTKEDYVFIGWDPELEPVTGDQTYEAVFIVAVPVTVSFDAWTNDGILIGDSSKVVYVGAKYGTLPTATRANHNFNGWWTEYDGGTEITATSIVTIEEDTTLYARFVPNAAYEQVLPMLDMIPLIAIAALIMIIVGGIFYYRTH